MPEVLIVNPRGYIPGYKARLARLQRWMSNQHEFMHKQGDHECADHFMEAATKLGAVITALEGAYQSFGKEREAQKNQVTGGAP